MVKITILIINFIILFLVIRSLIEVLKKRLKNTSKRLRVKNPMQSKLPMFALLLAILNMWFFILGKFYIVSFIFLLMLMACVIYMGAITEGN
ncbi:hypothetical protein C1I91_11990 [Clostridium manihotivorum]|uniref:Uncharacterized protein n=1 Tax=Clostridium manihotivorum TaxID=2320868 RepID=A0A3R5QY89_9CLOT|nr:hypothetical protein C1I91_11990 [Clostridium manihotivorum]